MKASKVIMLSTFAEHFKEALRLSLSIRVNHLAYRTDDQGLCSANIFFCEREKNAPLSISLLALMNHAVHFYEEWRMEESLDSDLNSITKWLIPAIQKADNLPLEDAQNSIQSVISSIEQCMEKKTEFRYSI